MRFIIATGLACSLIGAAGQAQANEYRFKAGAIICAQNQNLESAVEANRLRDKAWLADLDCVVAEGGERLQPLHATGFGNMKVRVFRGGESRDVWTFQRYIDVQQ